MAKATAAPNWALVLAGGDGTRLQDLTREIAGAPIPKQYCRLLGNHSLLEATLARSQQFAPLQRTLVIVNNDHLDVGREQLRPLPPDNVVVQPCNRDTGPGLLLALMQLGHRSPGATVAVFPSDHYVGDDCAFVAHVTRAATLVNQHPAKVVLLGIRPDRPEPGYGYITPARPFRSRCEACMTFRVAAFREKPTADLARSLFTEGGLWNSFVMVFRLNRMLELLQCVAPKEFQHMWRSSGDPGRIAEVYRDLTPWNFSTHVLARITQHLLVLPVDDVHWSDWGTRESIEHTLRTLNKTQPWSVHKQPSAAA